RRRAGRPFASSTRGRQTCPGRPRRRYRLFAPWAGFAGWWPCGVSSVMTDVVVGLDAFGDADLEAAVAGPAELVAGAGLDPGVGAGQLVLAAATDTFHDFGCAGVEGQGGGQNHANRLLRAVREGDAVADALAVEVHVGLGGDGYAVDAGSGQGAGWMGRAAVRRTRPAF